MFVKGGPCTSDIDIWRMNIAVDRHSEKLAASTKINKRIPNNAYHEKPFGFLHYSDIDASIDLETRIF